VRNITLLNNVHVAAKLVESFKILPPCFSRNGIVQVGPACDSAFKGV